MPVMGIFYLTLVKIILKMTAIVMEIIHNVTYHYINIPWIF